MTKKMIEPQYDFLHGYDRESLGLMSNQVWQDDPKRLVFMLARYKFAAKMLSGKNKVAEIGCGDGFGARIVKQEVKNLFLYDIDPVFISDLKSRQSERWTVTPAVHNILSGAMPDRPFDGIFSLDVMEHIPPAKEGKYLENIRDSLAPGGVFIVGMPSLQSQQYASPASKEGHVNCKSGEDLKKSLSAFFDNVFLFSMHDEVITTAFSPMAHYLIAIACSPVKKS